MTQMYNNSLSFVKFVIFFIRGCPLDMGHYLEKE